MTFILSFTSVFSLEDMSIWSSGMSSGGMLDANIWSWSNYTFGARLEIFVTSLFLYEAPVTSWLFAASVRAIFLFVTTSCCPTLMKVCCFVLYISNRELILRFGMPECDAAFCLLEFWLLSPASGLVLGI